MQTVHEIKKISGTLFCFRSTNHDYKHGDKVLVPTQYGELEIIIWKRYMVGSKDGIARYSYIRADGKTRSSRTQARANKRLEWAESQKKKAENYWQGTELPESLKGTGQPVLVGHHSEGKHRRILEAVHNNARKAIEAENKAQEHLEKSESIAANADYEINLDEPRCIESLKSRIAELKDKSGGRQTPQIRRYQKRLETAVLFWEL